MVLWASYGPKIKLCVLTKWRQLTTEDGVSDYRGLAPNSKKCTRYIPFCTFKPNSRRKYRHFLCPSTAMMCRSHRKKCKIVAFQILETKSTNQRRHPPLYAAPTFTRHVSKYAELDLAHNSCTVPTLWPRNSIFLFFSCCSINIGQSGRVVFLLLFLFLQVETYADLSVA